MTSSHDALYRAICAHPDEDTPRLAFADLIDENGENRRAAFIRTQIALARLPAYDPGWVSVRQHDPAVATGWCMTEQLPKPPSPGCEWNRFEFRRGFPWKIGVRSLAAFLESGDAVFDMAPIQAIDLDPRDRPDLASLSEWPHLTRLHRLTFSTGWFGPTDVARLAESPHISNVTELGFEFESISSEGLGALAASPLFGRLKALELSANNFPPALLIDALGAAPSAGELSRLSLPNNRVDRNDAEALFRLPALQDLQHLDVSDNPLAGEGIRELAESGIVRGLRTLNLSRTRPGVPGVKALTEAGGLAGLRLLDLSHNALGPTAVKAVAACSGFRGLRVLNLSNNHVHDSGGVSLAGSSALAGLLELDLCETGIGDTGALALAESPHLNHLIRLDLRTRSGRAFGDAARAALIERFGDRVCL
ncbi:Leucine-rich repeat-containing protein typical subtype OS=Herpetosiphon aurantiacus (strain ATCC 23779 / DSM 785) GN=Haur_4051 PE=4 SV=1: LRR_6: LRR_6: LRR_6 [Gemmata massiliana]|uniref:Repeat-companion domain protein n=1 Tax=Gemmata massiliana TaxID=1210884 RepID=A0A6P2DEH5_9BACT|nr:TIGR02996 domain-containing protein [Gemmata massiliana]VTR99883.1 Leucine-rich repeat-containing protein typical subtype OS=Herpetosiphon aurantiacus (strain ATCC 23779 / DSM 785) GN=Haur_4051 PE=4 SV=1: LRR_6: LRR_6: LRR_6 [Gemmata massiliana]